MTNVSSPHGGFVARTTEAAAARPGLFIGAGRLRPVRLVKEMIRRVGGDGTVYVVVQTLDGNLKTAESLAPALAEDFLAMGPAQIRSVDWNMKPVEQWYEAHWPLFVPPEDLRKARDAVREEVKKRKLAANPLAVELDDEDSPKSKGEQPAWMDPKQPLPREQVAERFKNYLDGFM